MLAKKYRLTAAFFRASALKERRAIASWSSPFLSVRIFLSPLPHGRFAVITPSAIFRTSVLRNKLRRMVYDGIRASGLHKSLNVDCVIYLKSEIKNASRQEVLGVLGKLPRKFSS